jgi:hypothetical protein
MKKVWPNPERRVRENPKPMSRPIELAAGIERFGFIERRPAGSPGLAARILPVRT